MLQHCNPCVLVCIIKSKVGVDFSCILKWLSRMTFAKSKLSCMELQCTNNIDPDDGGSKHLWTVGQFLPDYTVHYPRRQLCSYLSPWEPEISPSWKPTELRAVPSGQTEDRFTNSPCNKNDAGIVFHCNGFSLHYNHMLVDLATPTLERKRLSCVQ
jgi:hypothetical protein